MYPIDAVIPWVDGNTPEMIAKRNLYVSSEQRVNPDIAGDTRYADFGEIRYCVSSLLRFAPFLRKIFIITDGQNPQLQDFLDERFPDRKTGIEIVDHKVIFRGHEDCLPVFNSNAIDTFLWNIPDLSEHFIYLNDDFFLVAPARPEDFFRDGKVVCYGKWYNVLRHRIYRFLKPKKYGQPHVGFKDFQYNALKLMGGGWRFIYLAHSPRPLLKSWYEKFIPEHPDAVEMNIMPRFRNPFQWETQEPFYIDMFRKGRCILINNEVRGLYIKPRPRRKHYMDTKIRRWNRHPDPLYLCANSLDACSPEDLLKFKEWLNARIGL